MKDKWEINHLQKSCVFPTSDPLLTHYVLKKTSEGGPTTAAEVLST